MNAITILTWIVCTVSIALNIHQTVLVRRQRKKIVEELKSHEEK